MERGVLIRYTKKQPMPLGVGGFTLLEMMIAMAIAAILMTIAVPGFQNVIRNNRISAASGDLVAALLTAKAESAGRTNFVTVCKRNSGGSGCEANGGWEQGWLVFVDEDGDGTVDSGDEILYDHAALEGGLTAYGTSGITRRVTYRANGMTNLTSMQTLVLCDQRGYGDNAKGIMVSIIGRASTSKATDTGAGSCLIPS
ncbi:MAG: prepilin-type N-terminal cleavage/methylation domain-containing protein [Halieaceae bacterium]|nr:prepilin-type N-terminal cleavage/methylation domain-containing protein [Halieaceae bacterium]